MKTITITITDEYFEKLLVFINTLPKDEVEIIDNIIEPNSAEILKDMRASLEELKSLKF